MVRIQPGVTRDNRILGETIRRREPDKSNTYIPFEKGHKISCNTNPSVMRRYCIRYSPSEQEACDDNRNSSPASLIIPMKSSPLALEDALVLSRIDRAFLPPSLEVENHCHR